MGRDTQALVPCGTLGILLVIVGEVATLFLAVPERVLGAVLNPSADIAISMEAGVRGTLVATRTPAAPREIHQDVEPAAIVITTTTRVARASVAVLPAHGAEVQSQSATAAPIVGAGVGQVAPASSSTQPSKGARMPVAALLAHGAEAKSQSTTVAPNVRSVGAGGAAPLAGSSTGKQPSETLRASATQPACRSSDIVGPMVGAEAVVNLAYVHFPKAGTQFISTLVSVGCAGLATKAAPRDTPFDVLTDGGVQQFLRENQSQCKGPHPVCLHSYTRHVRVVGEEKCHRHEGPDGKRTGTRFGCGRCISILEHHCSLAAMFRQPEDRLVSGFRHNFHSYHFKGPEPTLLQYSKALAGCYVRMLIGTTCVGHAGSGNPTKENVDVALARLRSQFVFVGLSEHWALSVCLFHAMFGGACRRWEFAKGRSRLSLNASLTVDMLEGWKDEYDAPIYGQASAMFFGLVQAHGISNSACQQRVCPFAADAFDEHL